MGGVRNAPRGRLGATLPRRRAPAARDGSGSAVRRGARSRPPRLDTGRANALREFREGVREFREGVAGGSSARPGRSPCSPRRSGSGSSTPPAHDLGGSPGGSPEHYRPLLPVSSTEHLGTEHEHALYAPHRAAGARLERRVERPLSGLYSASTAPLQRRTGREERPLGRSANALRASSTALSEPVPGGGDPLPVEVAPNVSWGWVGCTQPRARPTAQRSGTYGEPYGGGVADRARATAG